jgi:hypothetical protein
MDLRYVALSEIDSGDYCFEIPGFADSPRLEDSLGRLGILDPVWLQKKSDGYSVVDGFKRFRWAEENGAEGLFCRIFGEDSDLRRIWGARIEKKIYEGELNPAEKARIIAVLAELFGLGEIPGFFLASLKVANRAQTLRKWVRLCGAGPGMLEALGCGEVCERAAIEIADWDPASSGLVLALLRALRCSASIQVEIVERINEIAIREEKSRAEVLEMEPVRRILSSKELNHREKTQALREYFNELRNPRLTSRRKRFEHDVEALGLPGGARVVAPEAFEGGEWQMELRFTEPEELRKIFRATRFLVESDRFDAIFGKR